MRTYRQPSNAPHLHYFLVPEVVAVEANYFAEVEVDAAHWIRPVDVDRLPPFSVAVLDCLGDVTRLWNDKARLAVKRAAMQVNGNGWRNELETAMLLRPVARSAKVSTRL